MTATAMEAALRAAGRNTAADRLYSAAVKALQDHDGSITDGIRDLVRLAQRDPEIIQALAADYLKRVAEDMRGLPGGGQECSASQGAHAPARQPYGDTAGQGAHDNRRSTASTSHPNGAGQMGSDIHSRAARPVREPSPSQRAAARSVREQINITVLDTYRIRDGRAIGDVRFGELEHLRSANAAEASLIRQIQRHGMAAHDAKVRDLIKPEELQRMIQRAAEVADAS